MSVRFVWRFIIPAMLLSSVNAVAAKSSVLPAAATFADPNAIANLFRNKTWVWAAGAAYFAPNQQFTAWSTNGAGPSYAKGRWFVTQRGKLCFRAVWHTKTGSKEDLTCFDNRVSGGTDYQRKLPSGPWYPFKSAQFVQADEYNKLTPGDSVSAKMPRMMSGMQ